jgi:RimJ/RimL family protein N-acetyltransferase
VLDDRKTVLQLRTIEPSDRDALHVAFHKLSDESRYQRFLGYFRDLSAPMLDYLTAIDGLDHYAIVAIREHRPLSGVLALFDRDRDEEIVGVARMIRLDGESAEIAITVIDEIQRKGLGGVLMQVLVNRAHGLGITKLVAHTLPSNQRMRRLLARHGDVKFVSRDTAVVKLFRPSGLRRWLTA